MNIREWLKDLFTLQYHVHTMVTGESAKGTSECAEPIKYKEYKNEQSFANENEKFYQLSEHTTYYGCLRDITWHRGNTGTPYAKTKFVIENKGRTYYMFKIFSSSCEFDKMMAKLKKGKGSCRITIKNVRIMNHVTHQEINEIMETDK